MKSYKIPPIPVDPSQKSQVVLFLLREIVKELSYDGEIDEEYVEIHKFVPEDQALVSTNQSPIVTQYIKYLDELIDNQIKSHKLRFFRLTTMVELLGILGDPHAVNILTYIINRDEVYGVDVKERNLSYAAIIALGMIGGTKAAKRLVGTFLCAQFNKEIVFIHGDENELELAKQALQKIGGQSAKTLIQTLLYEPLKVRDIIRKAIGSGGLNRDDLTLTQALETTKIRPQTRQAFADFETFGCG